MKHRRPTVADLLSMKGKRQLSMLRLETLEEAEAAERAGVDLVSVPPALLTPVFREAAPSVFAFPGLEYGDLVTSDEYIRAAFKALKSGGDAVYCAASLQTVRRMREEGIPVCGHVGLIPSKATWTGGFRAVGKTAISALEIWRQTFAPQAEGQAIDVVVDRAGERIALSLTPARVCAVDITVMHPENGSVLFPDDSSRFMIETYQRAHLVHADV